MNHLFIENLYGIFKELFIVLFAIFLSLGWLGKPLFMIMSFTLRFLSLRYLLRLLLLLLDFLVFDISTFG